MNNKKIQIGQKLYAYNTAKNFVAIFKILGIILTVLGALLSIVVVGIPFLIFGIVLLIYSNKLKKEIAKQTTSIETTKVDTLIQSPKNTYTPETTSNITNNMKSVEKTKSESEKDYDLFFAYDGDYYLAYEYEEKIALPKTEILTGNGGKKLSFIQEPNNEYDNNAVAIYLEQQKVGYIYRGRTQDMVNDWIKKEDLFWGYVNRIDIENNTATYKIGFYKNLNNLSVKTFKLTRITKKADEYESSRYENVGCCSDGDIVEYEDSFENDNYIVTDECGSELGELGAKAVEWIEENEDIIKFARINNIEETDSGSYKADIEIFYK